jgi:hypothetical protein
MFESKSGITNIISPLTNNNENALETSHRVVQGLFGENIADMVVMVPLSSNTASRR